MYKPHKRNLLVILFISLFCLQGCDPPVEAPGMKMSGEENGTREVTKKIAAAPAAAPAPDISAADASLGVATAAAPVLGSSAAGDLSGEEALAKEGEDEENTKGSEEGDEENELEEGEQSLFLSDPVFRQAVEENIFPAVVRITTEDGHEGIGFFQHEEWFVSNAHVFPGEEHIAPTTIKGWDGEPQILNKKRVFKRPVGTNSSAPDILTIESSTRREGINPLSANDLNRDEINESTKKVFYVYFNDDRPDIKELKKLSADGEYPMLYECEDGSEPVPGGSGAPIIEGAMLKYGSKAGQWQFKLAGMLYARCAREQPQIPLSNVSSGSSSRLVCAVPTAYDFGQLAAGVLLHKSTIGRYQPLSEQDGEIGEQAQEKVEKAEGELREALNAYETGSSELIIQVPEGLELLSRSPQYLHRKTMEVQKKLKEQWAEGYYDVDRPNLPLFNSPWTDDFYENHVFKPGRGSRNSQSEEAANARTRGPKRIPKNSMVRIDPKAALRERQAAVNALFLEINRGERCLECKESREGRLSYELMRGPQFILHESISAQYSIQTTHIEGRDSGRYKPDSDRGKFIFGLKVEFSEGGEPVLKIDHFEAYERGIEKSRKGEVILLQPEG